MIYINSLLESTVKDQLHLSINNDFTFWFANVNAMFIFLTSLSDNLDRQNGRVSALENLCQQNKPFSDFILEFT